jgi:hypothetical protein
VRPPALALLVLACAPALSTGPHDADYLQQRGREACRPGDARCCETALARAQEAAAQGDDRTADEQAERLALSCPAQARDLLTRLTRPPRPTPDETARLDYRWKVTLPAEDRIFWAAAYLDGGRHGSAVPGQHELVVEVHVLAGVAPGRGQLYRLRTDQPVRLAPGVTRANIVLARAGGPEPFRLEVEAASLHGVFGVLKMNAGSRLVPVDSAVRDRAPAATPAPAPRQVVPPRRPAPDFRPPSEWLEGGVHHVLAQSCADKQGRPMSVGIQSGGADLHPRLMGALVDWLRRFEYDAGGDLLEACEFVHPRFDQSVVPASPQGVWPTH